VKLGLDGLGIDGVAAGGNNMRKYPVLFEIIERCCKTLPVAAPWPDVAPRMEWRPFG